MAMPHPNTQTHARRHTHAYTYTHVIAPSKLPSQQKQKAKYEFANVFSINIYASANVKGNAKVYFVNIYINYIFNEYA